MSYINLHKKELLEDSDDEPLADKLRAAEKSNARNSLVVIVAMPMVTKATPENMKSGLVVHVANGSVNHAQNFVAFLRTSISFVRLCLSLSL